MVSQKIKKENQRGAIKRWRAKHPKKIKFYHYHEEARTFIKCMAHIKDLNELRSLIKNRYKYLKQQTK